MVEITAKMVKELREATGAAVLDCKNALVEHDGDVAKATEYLRQKGLAAAAKKAGRSASEGLVETYTHTGGRLGVMVEVNCETDFVARTPQFETFTHDLALHIAFHDPVYLDTDDIPEAELAERRAQLKEQALGEGKPEHIVDRIVDGRLDKWYQEDVLLHQPWIKDEKGEQRVKDVLIELIAELKENMVIKRFARFELGGDDAGPDDAES